jgi:ankyrin repeat protein
MDGPTSDLWFATMTGDVEAAVAAIKEGANVRVTNAHGLTPLIVCSGGVGPVAMMRLLLEHGADPNCEDKAGWTPLVFVASSGQLPLVETLLTHPATDMHVRTRDRGWTALTRAAYRGHAHVVRRLLVAGLPPDAMTDGKTAVQLAAEQGHAEVLAALQEWLADHGSEARRAGEAGADSTAAPARHGRSEGGSGGAALTECDAAGKMSAASTGVAPCAEVPGGAVSC